MANVPQQTIIMKWKEIKDSSGVCPKPRHGHRCVAYGKYIIIVGGGNEGIIREISVFNTVSGKWFCPAGSNPSPPGCAAFGIVCHEANLYIFGGIYEHGSYSNETYKISLSTWSWELCQCTYDSGIAPPPPRLGHSFTLCSQGHVYVFGGLMSSNSNDSNLVPNYSNDLYRMAILEDGCVHWSKPETYGDPPSQRESHSAVVYSYNGRETLVIYGGMCGKRLGDIHFLDIPSMTWSQPIVLGPTPLPRSLHVAGVVGNRMVVFGGWVPIDENVKQDEQITTFNENDWKCTNNVSCLNLENLTWEPISVGEMDDISPKPRAGHCGVMLNNRLYIWSGREGFRKSWTNHVCCKDFWFLETGRAQPPTKLYMDGTDTTSAGVRWDPIPNADFYIIQIMKVGPNTVCNSQDVQSIMQRNINALRREQAMNAQVANTKNLPALKPVQSMSANDENHKEETTPVLNLKSLAQEESISDSTNIQTSYKTDEIRQENKIVSDDTIPQFSVSSLNNKQSGAVPMNSTMVDLTYTNDSFSELNKGDILESTQGNLYDPNGGNIGLTEASRTLPPLGVTSLQSGGVRRTMLNPITVNQPIRQTTFNDVPLFRWYESIIVSEPKAIVSQFFIEIGFDKPLSSRSSTNRRSISLEPNFTYRVRVASVNTCGIGPFSPHLTFSTCVVGLPGPPANAKVIQRAEEIYLIWSPINITELHEYSVYISRPISTESVLPPNLSHIKYAFEKIYQDKETRCLISPFLENCYEIVENDDSYVLLRIVAKNCRGYGPVTQIKWHRDQYYSTKNKKYSLDKHEIPLKRFKAL